MDPFIEEQGRIFDEFRKVDDDRSSSFQDKMRRLTTTSQNVQPDSSIINQIFASFKGYSGQGDIEVNGDITIQKTQFDLWTERNNLSELSLKSFRNKYKKLYLYPKLHSLAACGFISDAKIVESWQSIEPHLPEIVDNIE